MKEIPLRNGAFSPRCSNTPSGSGSAHGFIRLRADRQDALGYAVAHMHILLILSAFGLLQTLVAVATCQYGWRQAAGLCLLPAVVLLAIQGWVSQINFVHLTENLTRQDITAGLASLLLLESMVKAYCLIDKDEHDSAGPHRLRKHMTNVVRWVEALIPRLPSVMFLFALVYGQSWLFHHVNGVSFLSLSLLLASGTGGFLALASWLLRKGGSAAKWESSEADILFLQFVAALVLPLTTHGALDIRPFHSSSVYIHAATTTVACAMIAVIGFGWQRFQQHRKKS